MKKVITLIVVLFLALTFSLSPAATVGVMPDGTRTVNVSMTDLGGVPYHGQVDFTSAGVDYITIINFYGEAFAWGYVEYDWSGNSYLYVSDDGYNFYYCP